MVISIDAENAFIKFNIHLGFKKISSESEHRGKLPQHNKGHISQIYS